MSLDENKIFLLVSLKLIFLLIKNFIQTNISIALILVPICPEPAILMLYVFILQRSEISSALINLFIFKLKIF